MRLNYLLDKPVSRTLVPILHCCLDISFGLFDRCLKLHASKATFFVGGNFKSASPLSQQMDPIYSVAQARKLNVILVFSLSLTPHPSSQLVFSQSSSIYSSPSPAPWLATALPMAALGPPSFSLATLESTLKVYCKTGLSKKENSDDIVLP